MLLKLEVLLLYFYFKFSIKRDGYAAIEKYISEVQQTIKMNHRRMDTSLMRIEREIESIVSKLERNNPCIFKSIVAYKMLKKRRYPVVIKTGIKFPPFAAHAWVEVYGERFVYGEEKTSKYCEMKTYS
ncbi:lasso peptide biosynthesis B2 protein [Paenibacillus sp. FSL W8-0426]|uniref:lasso peptide biosynthesis B2 protein n=1 Tax=Paenibacillus sp. FSL W8-0426 TaxID=2921714 RepID=UPI0030D7966E